jgi:hypothetical protein
MWKNEIDNTITYGLTVSLIFHEGTCRHLNTVDDWPSGIDEGTKSCMEDIKIHCITVFSITEKPSNIS